MKWRPDLSVGQRLAIGFGASGLLLAGLVLMTLGWLGQVAQARRRQTEIIAPRADAAADLEIAVLFRRIAARTYVLDPGEERSRGSEAAAVQLRQAVARLAALPKEPDGEQVFAPIPDLVGRFGDAADAFVALARAGASTERLVEAEGRMATTQAAALARVREMGALQRKKEEVSRQEISTDVLLVERSLLGVGLLVIGLMVLTGLVTAAGVRGPVRRLVAASRSLALGDFAPSVALATPEGAGRRLRDELAELCRAFGQTALTLRGREGRLRAGERFGAALASSLEVGRVCDAGLRELVAHLGAVVGAVYVANPDRSTLYCEASFGLGSAAQPLAFGEGIPGEAARSRASIVVRDVPADSPFKVKFGFDQVPPRALAAVPMVMGEKVVGAVLVGSLMDLDGEAVAFVEQSARLLAVSVQNALGHRDIERLAAEAQRRNEQLHAQNEELQAQQEELQAQQEELQSQQEELQQQSEELQKQNEELHSQGLELHVQADEMRRTVDSLAASREALKTSDQRKSDFLAVLSHELRNPLTPMRNSLSILERAEPGGPQATRALAVIARQVAHLARLIDDLLDLTRINRGKVELHRTDVDLAQLARQGAADNEALFHSSAVELALALPAKPVRVEGDAARLTQILGNLLQNAAKFTPAGGRVELSLEEAPGGAAALLRVSDSGVGIAPEVMGRLFEPFAQGDRSLARTQGGLGLGLALVKGLVELHGGTVKAASAGHGKGSAFTVELPLAAAARAGAVRPSPQRPRSRRVLIIEDNVDAAESLREALELCGHQVEIGLDGRSGLTLARQWRPDVVLCDIGLPEMNGYEVARALREDKALGNVYLVALSGYALPEDRRKADEAGFHEHLAKPPTIEGIEELLARVPGA